MNPTAQADIARHSSAGVWLFRGRRWLDPTDPHDAVVLAANHARLCALFPAVAALSGLAAFMAAVGDVSRRWAILSSSPEPAARTRWCTTVTELEDRTLVKTAGAPFSASDFKLSLPPAHGVACPRSAGLDVLADRFLSLSHRCEPCAGSVPPIFDASAGGRSPHDASMDTVTVLPRTAVGCYDGSGSAVSMSGWDHRDRPVVTDARLADAGSGDSGEAGLNAGQAVDRVLADLEPAGVALAALGPPDALLTS
jgi:hypothetical protein